LALAARKLTNRSIGERVDAKAPTRFLARFLRRSIDRGRKTNVLGRRQIGIAMALVRDPPDLPANFDGLHVRRAVGNATHGGRDQSSKNSKQCAFSRSVVALERGDFARREGRVDTAKGDGPSEAPRDAVDRN